ncbi:uncharacterized protein [Leptinotarsa decemlineata]|uniref:uncharacterized protein n=1 Tax=Leptinotarsa decemlineata TaxID=7539 RepID=UPI003D308054
MCSRGILMVQMASKRNKAPNDRQSAPTSKAFEADLSDSDEDNEPLSKLLRIKTPENGSSCMSQAAHDNLSDSEENNELLSKLLFKSSNETNPRNVTSHETTSEVANADAQPIISFQVPVNENFTLPPDIILHEIKSQNQIIPINDKEVLDSSGYDENISNHDFNAEMEILDEEIQDNLQNTERGIITEASSNVNRLRRSREVTKLKRLRGESYIGYTRSKREL